MSNPIGQVLTLGVGDERFAVPVTVVQEILDMRPISRLPHAPGHLLGVIDVRGDTVPVGDLRGMLGLEPAPDNEATRIIVLRFHDAKKESIVALRADRVFEVTELDAGEIADLPQDGLLRWDARMVAGLGRRNGDFVTVLNLETIFGATGNHEDDGNKAA
jgi:purine-binding chemotaxis protein CheW